MTAALRHRHISLDSNPLCKPAAQRWRYGLLLSLIHI